MMLTITAEEHILESFNILKGNNQTDITFDSLKEVLIKMGDTKMTDDDIRNMIEEADIHNTGKVSLEEFKKLLER
jgi:Ca2+-binding EF-hand superfamily protein